MTPTEPVAGAGGGVTLRAAGLEDADRVAELYAEARRAAVPAMPPAVHTLEEDRAYFAGVLAGPAEVWLAEAAPDDRAPDEPAPGEPVPDEPVPDEPGPSGFMVLEAAWLNALYVRPDLIGHGIGSALLDLAKVLRPEGFGLWVFESNHPARRFYDRHGLVAVRRTDGSANEERAPDVMMVWPGSDPVGALRAAVDDLDADLARLLELRAGLTRSIQDHKAPSTVPGRDPEREAEIVARMAPLAPRLGPARLARIMHTVITESLDAP